MPAVGIGIETGNFLLFKLVIIVIWFFQISPTKLKVDKPSACRDGPKPINSTVEW
jgi:hypothetical protein